MKKVLYSVLTASLLLVPMTLSAETWKNVSLMDGHCQTKMAKKADSHPTSCAIECAKSGYGIVTSDGKYLKFDAEGNKKALDALKATKKSDGLRVTVDGKLDGETIQVTSLSLD